MMLSMTLPTNLLFDSTFCSRLGLMLLHSLWQVAVLSMIAWSVERFWLKRSVEGSYWVYVGALLLALVAMPVTFWGLGSGGEWATSRAAEAVSPGDAPALNSFLLQAAPLEVIGSQANRPAAFPAPTETLSATLPAQVLAPTVWQRAAPWLVVAYGLGVVLMLVRLVRAWVCSNRLGNRAEKIVDGPLVETLRSLARQWSMRVVPMLAETQEMVLPKVVGLARPMILLPTAAIAGLSPDELEMILTHELAHVRRHDMWVNLLQRLAEVVLFFNPALWHLSRRISTLREYCCDEMTCQLMADAELKNEPQLRYATALLHIAELAQPNATDPTDLAALAATGRSPSELRRRVARLFGEPMREPVRVTRGALATVAALLLVLGFGSTVVSSTKESQESKQTVELKGSFSTQAASILSELLQENPVPFISEQNRAEIRLDFAKVINGFVASKNIDLANVPDARKVAILTSMRDRGAYFLSIDQYQHSNPQNQNSGYLGFPGCLKTLQWKIYMALNRGKLSESEFARRTEQQAWMLDIVRKLPDDRSLWRKAELDRLAVWFSDPLCTTFDRPLSDEHFSQFQQTIEEVLEGKPSEGASATPGNKSQKLLPGMSFRFLKLAVRTQWCHPSGADPFDFPTFDNDKIHGFGTHPLTLYFASMSTNNGRSEFLEVFEKSFSAIDATTDWFGSPPKNARNRDAALRWMRSQGKGDFAYDRKGLFVVRDARLLRLDVTSWFAADQISNEDLREQIESQGTDRIPLDDVFQAYRSQHDTVPFQPFHGAYIGVLNQEGNLALVHVEGFSGQDEISVRTRIRQVKLRKDEYTANQKAPGNSMTLRVTNTNGKPVADAKVFQNHVIETPNGKHPAKIKNHDYFTDADGEAVVTWAGKSKDLRIWVSKPGFVPIHAMWAKDFQIDGDKLPKEFEVVLEDGTEIGGTVIDERAEPIEGVKVEIKDATASSAHVILIDDKEKPGRRPSRVAWLSEGETALRTDSKGRWVAGNVPKDFKVVLVSPFGPSRILPPEDSPLRLRFSHPDYKTVDGIEHANRKQNPTIKDLRSKTATVALKRGAGKESEISNPPAWPTAPLLPAKDAN